MNTYTEPEFLAVAETLGYRRVNQSSRMGGTALAAADGGVVFVRDWEKCATPDDVERLLACYHSLERKNRAAAALGRMGGASTSPAKRIASRANGAKGGRPTTEFRFGKVFRSEGGFRVCGGVWAGGPIIHQSPWFATREEAERVAAEMIARRAENERLDRLAGLRP